MIVIIHPEVDIWNYVLSSLREKRDIRLFPLRQHCNFIQHGIRKITNLTTLPSQFVVGKNIRRVVSQLQSEDKVVLCDYTDSSLLASIARIVPSGVSCHLWLWNHKGDSAVFCKQLQVAIHFGYHVSTYDEEDADLYGLKWHSQFFCIRHIQKMVKHEINSEIDFFFVGYCKNRYKEIEQIEAQLHNYKSEFKVVRSSRDYVPYNQYLLTAQRARCIVDIVHEGENACTLRPLEAIALQRKLLTNNLEIQKYSFYNSKNIFILGLDDFDSLPSFLRTPFEPLPDDIVEKYDISHWVRSFR